MHDPREPHLHSLKRILRYIRGTLALGLHLHASPFMSLVAYSNADRGDAQLLDDRPQAIASF